MKIRKGSCKLCGYFREEVEPDGTTRYYCNDLDCTIDIYDPACNYNG